TIDSFRRPARIAMNMQSSVADSHDTQSTSMKAGCKHQPPSPGPRHAAVTISEYALGMKRALLVLLLGAAAAGGGAQSGRAARAPNVVLFLATGAAIPVITAASLYGYDTPRRLFVQHMPFIALSETSTASEWVTDSAAGMTAIVTG